MTIVSGDDVRAERARLVATLREAGPEAPTLIGPWAARDVASHLAAQDRLGGWPARLARTTVALTGVRLSAAYLDRPRIGALVNGRFKPWELSLAILSKPPPSPILASRVAVITLWEHFAHHEDVRRPNAIARHSFPDLEPILEWILRYNRHRMNRRVRAVTDGRTHEAGIGEPLTIAGPLPDVVLWLSGRATTDVELDAPVAEADDLRRRLAV